MSSKTALIHYFSGTGNTAHAVDLVTWELQRHGYAVSRHGVEAGAPASPPVPVEPFDLQLFAFPVYGFSAPARFLDHIRALPRAAGPAAAAVLSVNGATLTAAGDLRPGNSGGSGEAVAALLQRKGYAVFLTGTASYPVYWTQVLSPAGDGERRLMGEQGDEQVQTFADQLARRVPGRAPVNRLLRVLGGGVAWLFRCSGRRVLGKLFVADHECNGCGRCAKECPAGTIVMAGQRPVWGGDCQGCNRCINRCPLRAIQTSVLRLVVHLPLVMLAELVLAILIVEYGRLLVLHWPALLFWPVAAAAIAAMLVAVTWFQLTVLDQGVRKLERLPRLRPLFEWTFTRNFRRAQAPGFCPLGHGKAPAAAPPPQ